MSSITRSTKRLATDALLLGLLVAPFVGCNNRNVDKGEVRNVSAKSLVSRQMGIEDLRAALTGGLINEEQLLVLDNSNRPMRLEFLGRPRNVIWTEHTEGDVLAFERSDGIEVRRTSWPDKIGARSCSMSLVLPTGAYAIGEGLLALLRDEPKWYTEWDLKTYASTMLTFHGFYLIDKGKQSGANVLNYVSVVSYDKSLPEGRLNGMSIYIEREKVESTRDMKSALAEVEAKYPFSLLENYYKIGVDVFNRGMDPVGKTQSFE